MSEIKEHLKLKKKIYKILKDSKFKKSAMEVLFEIPKIGNLSADVVAIDDGTLFIFQCKARKNISAPEKEFGSLSGRIDAILNKNFTKITSETEYILPSDLQKIKRVKACYAFDAKLENYNLEKILQKFDFKFWDDKAVRYYEKTSKTIGLHTKHQIFKEFGIPFESPIATWEESAVEIFQEGHPTMYMLGVHPSILLEICYVYRRGSGNSEAYQRILNKDRLKQISSFLQKPNALLSNPVIIVFDSDTKIQNKICYRNDENLLVFPRTYCCAWIIDGQHRIFGFKDHPEYSKWTRETNNDFKIPVVAFENLPEIDQSRAFVDINYYQKRIDPSLFADLSTLIRDLNYPITWPNLLIEELNRHEPWRDMIKISELDRGKPISNNAFANLKLLDTLLGFKKSSSKSPPYEGILFNLAPFDPDQEFSSRQNKIAFKKQVSILIEFFKITRAHVKTKNREDDLWLNQELYGLTNRECVNALLLVLNQLLLCENDLRNWKKYVSAINVINYEKEKLLKYGRGFPAFSKIANKIIRKINRENKVKLTLIIKRKKK